MSEILDNALDSLRMGLRHYLDPKLEMGDKWTILELFHSIELLLKERLYEEHPLLIYRNVDKEVTDDAQTVGLAEALARFKNLDVELPPPPVCNNSSRSTATAQSYRTSPIHSRRGPSTSSRRSS